ncbi:hypothetical protein ACSZML_12140 [Aeromonas rivipollensis]
MRATLTELDDALRENTRLMDVLLQQQQYDEALPCMDERLALIGRLVQLAQDDLSSNRLLRPWLANCPFKKRARKLWQPAIITPSSNS